MTGFYKVVRTNILRLPIRPDLELVKKELVELGADMVVSDKELGDVSAMKSQILGRFGTQPHLGLNCVGGMNGTNLMRLLG